jgi:hypothetical protein
MNNTDKIMQDKRQEQQNNFIEGDNVVPQGGAINKSDEQNENTSADIYKQSKSGKKSQPDVNPPSSPPQKPEKKIRSLRNNV